MEEHKTPLDVIIGPVNDDDLRSKIAVGYPDETHAFEQFAKVLADIAGVPAAASDRATPIMIDFESQTEEEADRAVPSAWFSPLGFTTATFSTAKRTETVNVQNVRRQRHLTLIALGIEPWVLDLRVVDGIVNRHSCEIVDRAFSDTRPVRGIAALMRDFATGLGRKRISLFSRWAPGPLTHLVLEHGALEVQRFELDIIQEPLLAANWSYTTWCGTPLQARVFWRTVWDGAFAADPTHLM